MKHSPEVWHLARRSLEAGVPVALLYVVESTGSSPGRAGFALTVTADDAAGSIGGGAMEFRFLNRARAELAASGSREGEPHIQRQIHDKKAGEDASGMICSGEQTFVLMPLGERDLATVTALALATARPCGVLHLGADGISYDPAGLLTSNRQFVSGAQWSYDEDWGRRDHLHLVGGGHCALALSQLASGLDFHITVYDDRPGLPTFEANTWADQKVLLRDYSAVGEHIAPGAQQFVCVMTFGYLTDDKALRALLGRDYAFLGSLGSRSKIDKLLAAYTDEGWPAEALRRLHAPLGVPIHSQTPAEIAVSIAAQLIRVRNEPARRNL